MAGSGFENNLVFAITGDFSNGVAPAIANGPITDNQIWMGDTIGNANGSHTLVKTVTAGTGINFTGSTASSFVINSSASSVDLHTARYIVSAGGATDGANYTTIATAITAAIAATGVQTIFIQPGSYTENLTIPANINMSAYNCDPLTPNVTIIGTITCTDAGTRSFSGIRFQTNGATAILSVTGTAATIVNFENCYLNATSNSAIVSTTTNVGTIIRVRRSQGDLGTTGIRYFGIDRGTIIFSYCAMTNSGGSVTQSTAANDSNFTVEYSDFQNAISYSGSSTSAIIYTTFRLGGFAVIPVTTSGTGSMVIRHSRFESQAQSGVTVGAGTNVNIEECIFDSSATNVITGAGTVRFGGLVFTDTSSNINTTTQVIRAEGPSRTIGSANTGVTNTLTVTNSSNTASSNAAIVSTVGGTSAADAYYQAVVSGTTTWTWGVDNSDSDAFALSANAALGTTNVMRVSTAGEINYPLQPAFLAILPSNVLNVTGDGSAFTLGSGTALTEIFDQNSDFNTNGTFTAPVTGRYYLQLNGFVTGASAGTSTLDIRIVTSNRTYIFQNCGALINNGTGNASLSMSVLADMDAADTATYQIIATGGTLTADIQGSTSSVVTFVSGNLVA